MKNKITIIAVSLIALIGLPYLAFGEEFFSNYILLTNSINPDFQSFIQTDEERGFSISTNDQDITLMPGFIYGEQTRNVDFLGIDNEIFASVKGQSGNIQLNKGDVFITDYNKGIILKNQNGKCWRKTINNSGVDVNNEVTCPN